MVSDLAELNKALYFFWSSFWSKAAFHESLMSQTTVFWQLLLSLFARGNSRRCSTWEWRCCTSRSEIWTCANLLGTGCYSQTQLTSERSLLAVSTCLFWGCLPSQNPISRKIGRPCCQPMLRCTGLASDSNQLEWGHSTDLGSISHWCSWRGSWASIAQLIRVPKYKIN